MKENLACLIKGHSPSWRVKYTAEGMIGYCLLCDQKLKLVQVFDRDAEEWIELTEDYERS